MDGSSGHPRLAVTGALMDFMPDYWPAPAKLNLFLHVLGRREDGYHRLQTLFQFVDLHDRIWIRPREDGRIVRRGGLAGLNPERDLAIRAARLLQAHAQCRRGAEITIEKHIPVGGGLGGGSSDAATVLLALNEAWGIGLDLDALADLGLELGADVPVFVRGEAAWAEGVGERLTPVSNADLEQSWYLVVAPECGVSTAAIFADLKLTRHTPPITIRAFLSGQPGVPRRNDLEAAARRLCPEVGFALDWLARQPEASSPRMTGSGACVFAVCASRAVAQGLAERVPAPWRGFVVQGRNRSALHEVLARTRASGR